VDKRRLWNLIGAPGLAVTSLLFVFLLLGWQKAGATQDGDGTSSGIGASGATFTVSGTIVCGATGLISDVEVSVWDRMKSTVVTSDTSDHRGVYSVTLDEGTYYVEFIPPTAAGLDAEAFITMDIVTNTVVNVDFCTCRGWVSETVESGGDTGRFTSLALAPTSARIPHISYHRAGADVGLNYGWLSGTTWLTQTVDCGAASSLVLVPTEPHTPVIAYNSCDLGRIKLAYPLDNTTWISRLIAGQRAGQYRPSLILEPTYPYNPHICYYIPSGAYAIRHAYLSGTTWMSGTWILDETVEGNFLGGGCSIALEQTFPYTPHITYRRGSVLKHAWKSDSSWLSETVDSSGGRTSLALDSSDNPHIAYTDSSNRILKYAWKHGANWFTETVDSEGMVHAWPSLALDGLGNPHIAYYASTNHDLKYARFDGRVWIVQAVDTVWNYDGWGCSLALDQVGCPHISYGDTNDGNLKYTYKPPWWVYLPLIMRDCAR